MIEKEINLFGIKEKTVLSHINEFNKKSVIVLQAISEEQEKEIERCADKGMPFDLGNYKIPISDIYCGGTFDYNNDSDYDMIDKFHILNGDNSIIYTAFDYEKGITTTVNGIAKDCFTSDPFEWFSFNYCLIGKPERIIIYKCPLDVLLNNSPL